MQKRITSDSYSIRVLCTLCGEPADSLNIEKRCLGCAGITASDIRCLGIIAVAVGLVPFSIGTGDPPITLATQTVLDRQATTHS